MTHCAFAYGLPWRLCMVQRLSRQGLDEADGMDKVDRQRARCARVEHTHPRRMTVRSIIITSFICVSVCRRVVCASCLHRRVCGFSRVVGVGCVVYVVWLCVCMCVCVCFAGMLVVVDELPAPLSILRHSTSGSPVGLLVLSCRRACSCSRDVGPPCLLAIVHERMWLGYLCSLSSIFCVLYSSASPYCLPFQRRHYCHCSSSIVVAFSRVSNLISSKSDFTHGSYRCCIGAVYGGSEAPTVRRSS